MADDEYNLYDYTPLATAKGGEIYFNFKGPENTKTIVLKINNLENDTSCKEHITENGKYLDVETVYDYYIPKTKELTGPLVIKYDFDSMTGTLKTDIMIIQTFNSRLPEKAPSKLTKKTLDNIESILGFELEELHYKTNNDHEKIIYTGQANILVNEHELEDKIMNEKIIISNVFDEKAPFKQGEELDLKANLNSNLFNNLYQDAQKIWKMARQTII